MANSVEKVGLAERWLNKKRGGRKKMKIAFDSPMIYLLNGMVRANRALPLADAGANPAAPLGVYKAPDEAGQRQMIALQKFIEKKFLAYRGPRAGEGPEDIRDFIPLEEDETIIVGISQSYVNRIKDMMKHYKAIGQLASMVEPWIKLQDALEGKVFKVDDDVEEDLEAAEQVAAKVEEPEPEAAPA